MNNTREILNHLLQTCVDTYGLDHRVYVFYIFENGSSDQVGGKLRGSFIIGCLVSPSLSTHPNGVLEL